MVGGDHPDPAVVQEPALQPRAVDGPHQERDADLRGPARQPDDRERVVGRDRVGVRVGEPLVGEHLAPQPSDGLASTAGRGCWPRCSSRPADRERRSTAHARIARVALRRPVGHHDPVRGQGVGERRRAGRTPTTRPRGGRCPRSRTSRRRGRPCRSPPARPAAARAGSTSGRPGVQRRPVEGDGSGRRADVGVVRDHERAVGASVVRRTRSSRRRPPPSGRCRPAGPRGRRRRPAR